MQTHTLEDELRVLGHDMLEHFPALIERHLAVKNSLPGYDRQPPEESRAESTVTAQALIRALFVDGSGYQALRPWLMGYIEQRARTNVPIDSVLRAWQNGQGILFAAVEESSVRLKLSPDTAREAHTRIIQWLEESMSDISATYQAVAAEFERIEDHDEAEFLRELFLGVASPHLLRARGLTQDDRFYPLAARPTQGGARALIDELKREFHGMRCIVASLDGDVAAVVSRPPAGGGIGGVVAVGPQCGIADSPHAYALAVRILEAACSFGMSGLHTMDSVGLHLAVDGVTDLGEHLVTRFLSPVANAGGFGEELIATLETWFDAGLNQEEAARRLVVHRNTLAKRLRRYETLTGVDLGKAEDLFSVWWALKYRARRPAVG